MVKNKDTNRFNMAQSYNSQAKPKEEISTKYTMIEKSSADSDCESDESG